jgi:hypothetical protein
MMNVFAEMTLMYMEKRKQREKEYTNKLMSECLKKRETVLKYPYKNVRNSERIEPNWKIVEFPHPKRWMKMT